MSHEISYYFHAKKILKYYWVKHTPFSVSNLIDNKILHFPCLGRLTLRLMESHSQIIEHHKQNGEVFYVATTESKMEWSSILKRKRVYSLLYYGPTQTYLSMNRYEKQKLYEELERMVMEYSHKNDIPESYQYDTI